MHRLDALFSPRHVWFLGTPRDPTQAGLVQRLRTDARLAFRQFDTPPLASDDVPESGLLAIVADARFADRDTMRWLGTHGCRAVIWPLPDPPSGEVKFEAIRGQVCILGHRRGGIAVPAQGIDLTGFAASPLPGNLAMIMQSHSVACAAADWAHGRRIGFSWIAVTGAETDIDVADLLDRAALDPNTHAVALQLGRIRDARRFMSAARACSRVKPTVVLQTRPAERAVAGTDAARSAAFARSGLVEVPSLPALFDAIAAMQRLPAMPDGRVFVVANGAAVASLSVDAMIRHGLSPAQLPHDRQRELLHAAPDAHLVAGGVDLGDLAPGETVEVVRRLDATGGFDALVFVRAPTAGPSQEDFARAFVQAGFSSRVLTVWLGLEQAAAARIVSSAAEDSTFTSPDGAARAIRYRHDHVRNRELLTATPPAHAVPTVDSRAIGSRLATEARTHPTLSVRESRNLLKAYGIPAVHRSPALATVLGLNVFRHPELGMMLRVETRARGIASAEAFACPPLDPLVSARLLDNAGVTLANGVPEPDRNAAIGVLIRVAQLVMDQPHVARLDTLLALAEGRVTQLEESTIALDPDPPGDRERLALALYPSGLMHDMRLRDGRRLHVRPVRPSDEPALVALLQKMDPEAVRMRFFCHIRHFTHAVAARMTQIDYDREMALAAFVDDTSTEMVGMATLIGDAEGDDAEFALQVRADFGRVGLGSHLLGRLIEYGKRQGLKRIHGDVLMDNAPMLRLARRLGFEVVKHPHEDRCLRVEYSLVSPTA